LAAAGGGLVEIVAMEDLINEGELLTRGHE
jgi:hypothetical protein